MSYDETTLANMAIGHIGIGLSIGVLETENSAEAVACRRYFNHCRDFIYRMRRWPFAARLVSLQDLGVTGTLYDGIWAYRYNYPNFAMRINRIVNPAMRTPNTLEDKIKYEIVNKDTGSGGKIILCDEDDAIADYNHLIEDVSLWDAEFVENFTTYLAVRIGPSLKCDANLVQQAREQWSQFLKNAMDTADSESQPDVEPPSQFQTVRA